MVMKRDKRRRKHVLADGGWSASDWGAVASSLGSSIDAIGNATGLYKNLGMNGLGNSLANIDWSQMPKKNIAEDTSKAYEYLNAYANGYKANDNMFKTDMTFNGNFVPHKFVSGGQAGSVIQGIGSVAATTAETASANAQIAHQSALNKSRGLSNQILNTSIDTNTDEGLLSASRNMQSAYGLQANDLMRSKAQNAGATALGTAKGSIQGAAAGSAFGPWGALIGGAIGGAAGLLGGIFGSKKGKRKAEKQARKSQELAAQANAHNQALINQAANKVAMNREYEAMKHLAAYGGALDYDIYNTNANNSIYKAMSSNRMTALPTYSNEFAFGGNLQTHGGIWSNGLTVFNEGGSHEANPLGGIPQGVAPDGEPNLVEEGEVKWNDENYIFSNRLKVPKKDAKELGLKEGATFADAAKKVSKETEERPNDPISKEAVKDSMSVLMQIQEKLKLDMEAKKIKAMISKMSPEELEMLMYSMQQGAQASQEAQDEAAMSQEQMMRQQGMEMPQEQMPYEEYAEEPQYAEGGHIYEGGEEKGAMQVAAPKKWADYLKTEVDPGNVNSRYGYAPYYDKPVKSTLDYQRGKDATARATEQLAEYQNYWNAVIANLRSAIRKIAEGKEELTTEELNSLQEVRELDAASLDRNKKNGYTSLFGDNGLVDDWEDRIREYTSDGKNGIWHTYLTADGSIVRLPVEEPEPGEPYEALEAGEPEESDLTPVHRYSELPRYAPLAGSGINYIEALNRKPHEVTPAGVQYIGPQTVNDYMAYKPQDVLFQWNKNRAAVQGLADTIRNGSSPSSDAMRIAAMQKQQDMLGSLINNAERANYENYKAAVSHNTGVDEFNANQIYNADVFNAGQYDKAQANRQAAQLKNYDYEDDIFNSRLAARNNFYNNLGKLGESNMALNQRNALVASGYFGQQNPKSQHLLGLIDYNEQKRLLDEERYRQQKNRREPMEKIDSIKPYLPLDNAVSMRMRTPLVDSAYPREAIESGSSYVNVFNKYPETLDMMYYQPTVNCLGGKVNTRKYTKRRN